MSAELELQLVREALENVLSSRTAGAVLFEALTKRGGDVPASREELLAFLRGELRDTLVIRQGPASLKLLDDVERMLERPHGRSHDSTREVPILTMAVIVYVLASNNTLARSIEGAMGTNRVSVKAFQAASTFREAVRKETPAVVVLESATFPPIEPTDMAELLRELPETTVRAVSGIDTPYGSAALSALANGHVPCTPLDRREGIEPLLDLIRSRRG